MFVTFVGSVRNVTRTCFLELFSRIQHLSASLPLARPYPDITPSPQFTFVERQLLYSHLCFYPPLSPGLYFSCFHVQRPSRSPVRAALNAYSGASTRRRPKTAKLSSSWVAVCVARNRRMRLGRRRTWRRRWTSEMRFRGLVFIACFSIWFLLAPNFVFFAQVALYGFTWRVYGASISAYLRWGFMSLRGQGPS